MKTKLNVLSLTLFCATPLFNHTTAQIFSEQTSIELTGVAYSSVAWGDYNNDGFLDILMVGLDCAKVYKNDGIGNFTEQKDIVLTKVSRTINGSVSWGDYNNDGWLDILLTGDSSNPISKIYKNNGNDTFSEQTQISLTGIEWGSVAWSDCDNDGDLDILLVGCYNDYPDNQLTSEIYKNNGDGTFFRTMLQGAEVFQSSLAWGDYDNDGYQDILITGYGNGKRISKIYKNNSDGSFTEQVGISLIGVNAGSAAWGDYDNDGDLDILLAGYSNSGNISKIYKNNGNSTFTELVNVTLPGINNGTASWGDYDNDGDLDILLAGGGISKIYKNDGDDTFTEETGITLPGINNGTASWGDYDNDGDLDILITGRSGSERISKIYKNNCPIANSIPNAPTNLQSAIDYYEVTLKWDKAFDKETPQNGLSYNIRIGSIPEGNDIQSSMTSSKGYRLLPCFGNVGQRNDGYNITLPVGTYYWSVQAVDNNYACGAWAAEKEINITAQQATELNAIDISSNGIKLSWKNGNGSKRIVFISQGKKEVFVPVNNTTYLADTLFSRGTKIDSSGWYCVYNGTGTEVSVYGLSMFTEYTIVIMEYFGNAGSENYNTLVSSDNHLVIRTEDQFIGVYNSSGACGDYDNDGDLDILLTGSSKSGNISKIYKNIGDGNFTEQTGISLPGVSSGSVTWGDYDNDGDLDIFLTGSISRTGNISKIFKNNGNETFIEQTEISLPGISDGSLACGDYDNDGDLDILLTGLNNDGVEISKIYKNTGFGSFIEQKGISLPGVSYGYSIWGDYDNDGNLDILLTGRGNNGSRVSKIFKNNNNGTFTELTGINLPPSESITWGDYDNDGDLDILIINDFIKIYKNNGDGSFTEPTNISLARVKQGSATWGDYDNDGDLDVFLTCNNGDYWDQISKIFINNDGSFTEQAGIAITGVCGSTACGDYDNDGDLDILLVGTNSHLGLIARTIKNNCLITNTVPNPPANLQSDVNYNQVTLKWDKATDNETPQNGLSYNVRIGSTPEDKGILNPMSSETGYRLKPSFGNAGAKNDGYPVNLSAGTYYWSVQAIDNNYAGGLWSPEATFTVTAQQASDLNASNLQINSMKLRWQNGNGSKRIVFIAQGNKGNPVPLNNITYLADTIFSHGTQIDSSGWYCIYNGTGTEVNVSGLDAFTNYSVAVMEYTGQAGNEKYNISLISDNLITTKTRPYYFEEQTGIILASKRGFWGDLDNDGYLDILVNGKDSLRIYKNNNNNSFTKQKNIALPSGNHNISIDLGDYDNDGLLDILAGIDEINGTSRVFRNNGDNTFKAQSSIMLPCSYMSSVAWGDYNNDGKQDILLTGYYNMINERSTIFRNNGDDTFEQTDINLPGATNASVAWCDYDNDGHLDIFLKSALYKNNGDGTFTDGFSTENSGSVCWGDYNNDGYSDVLSTGSGSTKIYKNNGDGTFSEQTGISIIGIYEGSAAWGDFNNDGYLDILLTGSINRYPSDSYVSKIYRNNGNNSFTEETKIKLEGGIYGAWGDYDNDGKLDFLQSVDSPQGHLVRVYKNTLAPTNNVPSAPTNLSTVVTLDKVLLNWNKANDIETPQDGLTYNIRVGTSPGNCDIVSPISLTSNGHRSLAAMGNTGKKNSYKLNDLQPGTYRWSVQAIDQSYAGGVWAIEDSFTITTKQASNIIKNKVDTNAIQFSWINGNGDSRIVIMAEGYKQRPDLNSNASYISDSVFRSGSQIGNSGWYCLYKGINNKVNVTGLKAATIYSVAVLEYYSNAGSEKYINARAPGNPITFNSKGDFTKTWYSPDEFSRMTKGSTAIGDYDNDGYLDIFLSRGNSPPFSTLFKNKLQTFSYFSSVYSIKLPNVCDGASAWGDYDNDGDLDLLITGSSSTGYISTVCKNNGDGNFTKQSGIELSGVYKSSVAWGDYNNDGLLDILLTGISTVDTISKIYKNNGDGTFAEQSDILLPGISNGSVAWGDYNVDGYLDILLTGNSNTGPISTIYKNNGDGTFNRQTGIILEGVFKGSAVWGDYNNDGYLDILLTGLSSALKDISKIYRNNGDGSFTELKDVLLTGVSSGIGSWGDYDHDGFLDILLAGYANSSSTTEVFRNNGDETFSKQNFASIAGTFKGLAAWSDFDSDGDLDILTNNYIYRNDVVTVANNAPSVPNNLKATLKDDIITFTWNKATDQETPQDGLSYNLYVYDDTKNNYLMAPEAFAQTDSLNGRRLVSKLGSIQYNPVGYVIKGLPSKFRWSVQAIDGSMQGGLFAPEMTFITNSTKKINKINKVKIYPNPAINYIFIEGTMVNTEVSILSNDGKILKTFILDSNINCIDISDIATGFYLLKLKNSSTLMETKLLFIR